MVEAGGWDGTIAAVQFKAAAVQLVQRWEEICRDSPELWRWQDAPSASVAALRDKAGGYVVLENVIVPTHHVSMTDNVKEDNAENSSSYADNATLVSESANDGCHIYTFHIVYSESYKVPVMFFRGCFPDGSPLLWDDILQDLPCDMHTLDEESRWTFVTQQDHPYLQRPWFCLHPCATGSLLALVFSECETGLKSSNSVRHRNGQTSQGNKLSYLESRPVEPGMSEGCQYLVSWLSFVGPILGLNVPITLFSRSRRVDCGIVYEPASEID